MKDFLKSQKGKFISLDETVRNYPETHLHDLALPVIFVYEDLFDRVKKKSVFFLPGLIVCLNPSGRSRLYHYDPEYDYPFEKIRTPVEIQTSAWMGRFGHGWKGYPQHEYFYRLASLFEREEYSSGKRFKTRISYPMNLAERYGYETVQVTESLLPEAKKLHDAWVRYKTEVQGVRMDETFYWNVMKWWLSTGLKDYFDGDLTMTFFDGKPFGVDCHFYHRGVVYDMIRISAFFQFTDYPSTLAEAANVMEFKTLLDRGYEFYTSGIGGSLRLDDYKAQYPHLESTGYHIQNRRV